MDSIEAVVREAGYFRLDEAAVQRVLREVLAAIGDWKRLARSAAVGMSNRELDDFAPAFENEQMGIARRLLSV